MIGFGWQLPISHPRVPNRFRTGYSPQETERQLEEIIKGWRKQTRPVQLLLALCRLVADSDSGGADGFSVPDLVDALQKSCFAGWGGEADPDRFRKLVNRNWNDLETIWAEHRQGIIEQFNDSNLKLIPELDRKEGGGRWHPTRYWLKFSPADEGDSESRKPSEPVPPAGSARPGSATPHLYRCRHRMPC